MLVDDVLPVYDVSDAVATVVDADVATTWEVLIEFREPGYASSFHMRPGKEEGPCFPHSS